MRDLGAVVSLGVSGGALRLAAVFFGFGRASAACRKVEASSTMSVSSWTVLYHAWYQACYAGVGGNYYAQRTPSYMQLPDLNDIFGSLDIVLSGVTLVKRRTAKISLPSPRRTQGGATSLPRPIMLPVTTIVLPAHEITGSSSKLEGWLYRKPSRVDLAIRGRGILSRLKMVCETCRS